MSILTLTTDLGTKDYYTAALKAAVYSLIPEVRIVDITHHIPAFDLAKAGFVLRNVWREFPTGTIHVIGVDTQWSQRSPFVVVQCEGHYFIGCDNGIFSLILDAEKEAEVYTLRMKGDEDLGFPTKTVFVPAAAAIAGGTPLADLGQKAEHYKVRQAIHPVVEYDNIRGTVIYVDGYGNVITNITRGLFEREVGNKPFSIVLRSGDRDLDRICRSYSEVPEGEKLALFTSGGYLEIAINHGVEGSGGGASSLLGLREDDIVRVEFGG